MSWEEKYNELKIEHGNLTRKYNEAFQALRIKNDNQRDYEDLFTAFSEIQRKHRSVVEKYKAAHQTIAKLKRENQSQKRRLTGRALQTKNQKTSERGVPKAVLNDRGNVAENDNHNVEINHELMERLISAERQLKSLSVQEIARPISDAESDAAATLRQQLQETTVRLNLLKSQNEYAESKMKAQGEKLEQILLLHGEYRTKYTALKKELQFYRADNEALEAKASKIDDMKELITELTEQNSFLEGQVTKLCVPAQVNDEKQMLIATIHEKETANAALILEQGRLKQENMQLLSRLDSLQGAAGDRNRRHSSSFSYTATPPEAHSDDKQRMQQQCDEKDEELERSNRMLTALIAINEALERKLREQEELCREEVKAFQKKNDELMLKSSQRLQRIRLLESSIAEMHLGPDSSRKDEVERCSLQSLGSDENLLEVRIACGSFDSKDITAESQSFVLVDFHSFQSMISPITRGINPAYEFDVSYKLKINRFTIQSLAEGSVRVEVYVLNDMKAEPTLYASASISTADLFLTGSIHMPKLMLIGTDDDSSPAGTLDVTLKLAQPLKLPEEYCHDQLAPESERIFPDAIQITVDRVALANYTSSKDVEQVYFVHFHFLDDEFTDLESPNEKGEISFKHTSTIPILATPQLLGQTLSRLSKRYLRFIVFIGSKEPNGDEFRVVGEAHVTLRDLFHSKELATQIVSLQAKVVGTILIRGETIEPISSTGLTSEMKSSMRERFMTKIEDVFDALTDKESNCILSEKFARLIDAPAGILQTADALQGLIEENCSGQAFSRAFGLRSNEPSMNQHDFQCCVDKTRCRGPLSASNLPPKEEIMDLFQYLSDNDGMVSVQLLDFFIASESLKDVIASFRELKRLGVADVNDIYCIDDELCGCMTIKSLTRYFQSLSDQLEDDQWLTVFPSQKGLLMRDK